MDIEKESTALGDDIPQDVPSGRPPTPWDELPEKVQERIRYAQSFAELGINVIELWPGTKVPKRHHWQHCVTRNPEEIERFLSIPNSAGNYPNYGLNPGQYFVAIDLDEGIDGKGNAKDGRDKFGFIELANDEPVPPTIRQRTPSGGEHIVVRVPEPVSNSAVGFPEGGIDVRGIHGQIVGAGSELIQACNDKPITEGVYALIEELPIEVADAPEWLVDRLRTPQQAVPDHDIPLVEWDLPQNIEQAKRWLRTREPATQGDGGDYHTMQTAMWLSDFAISPVMALVLLAEDDPEHGESWNQRCAPPWIAKGAVGTLEAKIASAYKSAENRPGCKAYTHTAEQRAAEQAATDQRIVQLYGEVPNDNEIPTDKSAPDMQDISAHIYSLNAFLKAVKPRKFAMDRWLPAKGISFLLAKRGTGKSAVLTDLACLIASGHDWHGVEVDKDRVVAVYLCGEDDDGLALNLRAWQAEHGIEIDPSRLIVSDQVMQLKNGDEVTAWADALKRQIGDRKAIVIIDTWQRATSSAKSQSEESDISTAFKNAEYLLNVLDAPGLFAAHPPKAVKHEDDLSVMGTSLAENQAVAIWTLWDTDTDPNPEADHNLGLRLRVAKVRGARKGAYHLMRLREVALPETRNNFGREYEGVVVERVGGVADLNDAEAKRQEREREEEIKAVYADMVRHLFAWRYTNECLKLYGDKGFNPTQNGFAEEAARQMKTEDSYLKQMWGQSAKDVGIEAFGTRTIRNALAKHFRPGLNRPSTYDYDDGTRLTVSRRGRTKRAECYYELGANPLITVVQVKKGER